MAEKGGTIKSSSRKILKFDEKKQKPKIMTREEENWKMSISVKQGNITQDPTSSSQKNEQ
jgi:hypothetical protein